MTLLETRAAAWGLIVGALACAACTSEDLSSGTLDRADGVSETASVDGRGPRSTSQHPVALPDTRRTNGGAPPPTCPPPQFLYEGSCVSPCPEGQEFYMGACLAVCTGGQVRVGATCACPGGQDLVGGVCQCTGGQTLVNGQCQCPGSLRLIDGTCREPICTHVGETCEVEIIGDAFAHTMGRASKLLARTPSMTVITAQQAQHATTPVHVDCGTRVDAAGNVVPVVARVEPALMFRSSWGHGYQEGIVYDQGGFCACQPTGRVRASGGCSLGVPLFKDEDGRHYVTRNVTNASSSQVACKWDEGHEVDVAYPYGPYQQFVSLSFATTPSWCSAPRFKLCPDAIGDVSYEFGDREVRCTEPNAQPL